MSNKTDEGIPVRAGSGNIFAERIKRANPDDMLSILELAGTDEMEIECHDLIEPDLSTES